MVNAPAGLALQAGRRLGICKCRVTLLIAVLARLANGMSMAALMPPERSCQKWNIMIPRQTHGLYWACYMIWVGKMGSRWYGLPVGLLAIIYGRLAAVMTQQVIDLNPQVGKVLILGNNTFLPIVLNTQFGNNHSFADAWPISRNSTISQNFSSTRTLVNVYSFTVSQLSQIQVALTGVASTANVNLYLYGENKTLLQSDESPFPGNNKTITRVLNPGRYYVMVRYNFSFNFPNDLSDYYQLRVGG